MKESLRENTGKMPVPLKWVPWLAAAVIAFLLAIFPAVLWPGDVHWLDDQPLLVAHALQFNQIHRLARRGLSGSFPIPYGPFPTHVYQLLLLFTHDLRTMVVVRAVSCAILLTASLLWLGRTLRLTPWLVPAVVLAPYVLWGERTLWDCSFEVPICSFALAAYASFLRTGSGRSLIVALAAATLAPLIHLMALPFFVAVAGHALWRHRPALRQHRKGLAAALGIVVLLNGLYILRVTHDIVFHFVALLKDGHVAKATIRDALCGPFLGGRLLGGDFFLKSMCHLRGPAWLIHSAELAARIPIVLVWAGMAIAIIVQVNSWLNHRRTPRAGAADGGDRGEAAPRDTLIGIALTCLVLQLLLVGPVRCPPLIHYGFGMFPFYVLFAWLAVDLLQRVRLGLVVIGVWSLALSYITLGGAWQVHHDGWARGWMSPPLNDQIEVAHSLNRYSNPTVWTEVPAFTSFPETLACIRQLGPRDPNPAPLTRPNALLIRYRPGSGADGSRIEMIEIHSAADIPVNARQVDLSPPQQ